MILKIYVIGVLITFLSMMLSEHFYLGCGDSNTVTTRAIVENLIASIVLSWLLLIGLIIFFIAEFCTGFPSYGYSKKLHSFTEYLKRNHDNDTNS